MRASPADAWYALGALAVLFVMSRTKQGQALIEVASSSIRGFRLNNPLNIERGEAWLGLAQVQPDARFANFLEMKYGVRAAAKILQTYRSYDVHSVRGIIDRWNPISDGQPAQYKPNVAAALGVPLDSAIDVRVRSVAFPLLRAMIRQELGAATALLVSDADVHDGLTLAGVA